MVRGGVVGWPCRSRDGWDTVYGFVSRELVSEGVLSGELTITDLTEGSIQSVLLTSIPRTSNTFVVVDGDEEYLAP
jgi:hypothetical protein